MEGFAKMYHNSWKEELEHADKLRAYAIKRGSDVTISDIQVSLSFDYFLKVLLYN